MKQQFSRCLSFRNDIEIPDEETEEEIIRRQRLRREQLIKVNDLRLLITFH